MMRRILIGGNFDISRINLPSTRTAPTARGSRIVQLRHGHPLPVQATNGERLSVACLIPR
jgi:hypothetical protein